MLRRVLLVLVLALPVLLVAFSVVMAGFALTSVIQDALAATVLWWIAMACLMLLAVDLILLVATVGIAALSVEDERDEVRRCEPRALAAGGLEDGRDEVTH